MPSPNTDVVAPVAPVFHTVHVNGLKIQVPQGTSCVILFCNTDLPSNVDVCPSFFVFCFDPHIVQMSSDRLETPAEAVLAAASENTSDIVCQSGGGNLKLPADKARTRTRTEAGIQVRRMCQ